MSHSIIDYANKLTIYILNIINNISPLNLVIVFFLPIKLNIHSMSVETHKRIKLFVKFTENFKGVNMAPTPSISNKFSTHEPTRFPTAKSVSFLNVAIMDVTNSGIAVPKATIVKPITLSEILK